MDIEKAQDALKQLALEIAQRSGYTNGDYWRRTDMKTLVQRFRDTAHHLDLPRGSCLPLW